MAKLNTDTIVLKNAIVNGTPIVVFDVESTGLSDRDEIIQFAAIKLNPVNWTEIDRLNIYIKQDKPINMVIVELTGITDECVQQNGIEKAEAYQKIKTFLMDAVICGYNLTFDIKKVNYLFSQFGDAYKPDDIKIIDVYKMIKVFFEKTETPNQKLSTMIRYMKQDGELAYHNALDDVIATGRLAKAIYEQRILNLYTDVLNPYTEPQEMPHLVTCVPRYKEKGAEKVIIKNITKWTQSKTLSRIYVNFKYANHIENKVFIDVIKGTWEDDQNGETLKTIDLDDLWVKVFDLILSKGFINCSKFEGSVHAK